MKKIIIEGQDLNLEVLTDWDNNVVEDIAILNLKKGDNLGIFWRNFKDFFCFTSEPYYTKPYHPQECLDYLAGKNPKLLEMIEMFDMALTV